MNKYLKRRILNKMDKLGIAGIILIKRNDRLINLFLSKIGIIYSDIGIYYKKIEKNLISYKAIIIQTFPLSDVLIREVDLSNYFKFYNIESIHYKKLKNNNIDKFMYEYKNIDLKVQYDRKKILLNFLSYQINAFGILNTFLSKLDTYLNIENAKIFEVLYDSDSFEIDNILSIPLNLGKSISNVKYFEELLLDNNFYNKMIETFTKEKYSNQLENILITNFINSSKELCNTILDGIKNKRIKYYQLNKVITLLQSDYKKMIGEEMQLNTKEFKQDLLVISDDKIRTASINNIKIILNVISNDVLTGNIPTIKLNKLIINFNNLLSNIDTNYRYISPINPDISSYGLIITNDTISSDIPIQLKNGDKLLIPMNETNYSRFTKEQLEEMLTLLDVYSNGNNKFDQTRSLITKELSKKETIRKSNI